MAGPPVIETAGGVVSAGGGGAVDSNVVHVRVAGEGSVPFLSVARTANVCVPVARFESVCVAPPLQSPNAPLSTAQENLLDGVVALNANATVVSLLDDPSAGPLVIVVSGGAAGGFPALADSGAVSATTTTASSVAPRPPLPHSALCTSVLDPCRIESPLIPQLTPSHAF
jgi:hypothetical protein